MIQVPLNMKILALLLVTCTLVFGETTPPPEEDSTTNAETTSPPEESSATSTYDGGKLIRTTIPRNAVKDIRRGLFASVGDLIARLLKVFGDARINWIKAWLG
uniref:Uncharacterized protein n=1 Tax=Sphaerodactylus townsendi TaxID=933632 RepID=A0ACB8EMF4_9SAUR